MNPRRQKTPSIPPAPGVPISFITIQKSQLIKSPSPQPSLLNYKRERDDLLVFSTLSLRIHTILILKVIQFFNFF
jgi:hypothetical protein